jgi:ADP-ribose pyrophosphatase
MRPWRRVGGGLVHRCRVFDLNLVRLEPPEGGPPREFYVVDAPDWINVVPVTDDGQVVLVRQYRFGIHELTLEVPGGVCDPGEPPEETARRELLEETGYAARELVPLGWVHPNPAVQSNRCHCFLALGCRRVADPDPDPDEAFEVVTVPMEEARRLLRDGGIRHALVLTSFQLMELRGLI